MSTPTTPANPFTAAMERADRRERNRREHICRVHTRYGDREDACYCLASNGHWHDESEFPLVATFSWDTPPADPPYLDDDEEPDERRERIGAADAAERLRTAQALAWQRGADEMAEWMTNNPGPSGIPHDPPRNPYEER